MGSKYITVTSKYGRKFKFNKESLYCEEWSIYHLEESVEAYKERNAFEEKQKYIRRNDYRLFKVLSKEEVEDIYERLKALEK